MATASMATWRTEWWQSRPTPQQIESWTMRDNEMESVNGFRILKELLDRAAPPRDSVSWTRTLIYLPVLDALPMMDKHPPLQESFSALNVQEKNVLQTRIQALLWTKVLHLGQKAPG